MMTDAVKAFARVAEKRSGSPRPDLVEAILDERADLRGKTQYPIGLGKEAHTVFIGGEFFKSPLDVVYDEELKKFVYDSERAIAAFDREIDSLQQLQGKGLPIPEITCVGKESVFYGMTRIEGAPLGEDFESMYSPDEQRLLAQDIIGFIVDMANALPLKNGAFVAHDDLHCNNIFVNRDRRLSGVIDFGMVKYCTKEEWFPRGGYSNDFCRLLEVEFDRRKAGIVGYFPAKKSLHRKVLTI